MFEGFGVGFVEGVELGFEGGELGVFEGERGGEGVEGFLMGSIFGGLGALEGDEFEVGCSETDESSDVDGSLGGEGVDLFGELSHSLRGRRKRGKRK